jgi:hypothetical protein
MIARSVDVRWNAGAKPGIVSKNAVQKGLDGYRDADALHRGFAEILCARSVFNALCKCRLRFSEMQDDLTGPGCILK